MTEEPRGQPDLATENARLRSANAKLVEACRRVDVSLVIQWGERGSDSEREHMPGHWRPARKLIAAAIAEAEARQKEPAAPVQAALTKERLEELTRDPRYWRDRDPVIVRRVTAGYRALYPD